METRIYPASKKRLSAVALSSCGHIITYRKATVAVQVYPSTVLSRGRPGAGAVR